MHTPAWKFIQSILFLSFLSLIACENDPGLAPEILSVEDDYWLIGSSNEYCLGEDCVEIFRLQNQQIYEDILDQYPQASQPYQGSFIKYSVKHLEKLESFFQNLPPQLLQWQANKIGLQPNSEGKSFYLEIHENGRHRFWLIDQNPNNVPEELRSLVEKIHQLLGDLRE